MCGSPWSRAPSPRPSWAGSTPPSSTTREADQLAAVLGDTAFTLRPQDTLLHAWRGTAEPVTRALELLPARPDDTAVGCPQVQMARTAQGVLFLALGRYGDALRAARTVYDEDPPYWGQFALSDLVEAGVRGGDRVAAEAA